MHLRHGACAQIASALSRPEDISARDADTAAGLGDAAIEADSFLSPDEALHSIHEEPEEAAPDDRDLQPQLGRQASSGADLAKQGQSRKPSFTQPPGIGDRQHTPTGQHPVCPVNASPDSCKDSMKLTDEAHLLMGLDLYCCPLSQAAHSSQRLR